MIHAFLKHRINFIIIGLSLIIFAGMFLYGWRIFNDLQRLRESEVALFNQSRDLDVHFREFQRALGFGGFIHNVKEYLLHRDPDQLFILEMNIQELETAYASLKEYFQAREPAYAIAAVDRFVSRIKRKHEQLIAPENRDLHPLELDALLDIEAPELLSALVTLESLKDNYHKKATRQIKEDINELVKNLMLASVLLPLTLVIGMYFVVLFNREMKLRRNVEEARTLLKKSQERFALAMDATRDGLFDWDLVSEEIYYSPGWKRMLGYEDDELPNDFSVWEKLTEPEDVKRSWKMQGELIDRKRDRFELELKMKHKDGRWVDIFSRATAIFDDAGKAVRIVGTHVDVTERKRAERKIQEKEEALRLSLDAADAGTWTWDVLTGEVVWDDQMQRTFGLTPGTFGGTFEDWKKCVHPDDVETAEKTMLRALSHGEKYNHDYRVRRSSGGWKTVNAQAATLRDESGSPIRMSGFAMDITVRTRAEEALRKSERELWVKNRIAKIFLTIPDDDIYGEVLNVVLEAMESPYGTFAYIDENGDRVVPSMTWDIWDRCLMSDKKTFFPRETWRDQLWARSLLEMRSIVSNGPFTLPEGHIPLARAMTTPIIHNNEAIGNFVVADKSTGYTDLDRILLETIAAHIAPILHARLLSQRYEKELILAKEAAEAANKAKSQFLSIVSHELRTPLNSILGFTQILKNDPELADRHIAQIDIMRKGGEHLLALINDILDFSRIEAGKMKLRISTFDFNKFLDDFNSTIRLLTRDKNLDLIYQPSPHLPGRVRGDEKRLRQVLFNLVSNAVKYTEKGSVVFTVAHADDRCRFNVADTGAGIPPDKLEEIFLPFSQVEYTYGKTEGVGMGLSISQKIVRAMGSRIHVESAPGEGSAFSFEVDLPAEKALADENGEAFERKIIDYKGDRIKILIVDDNDFNRELLKASLSEMHFELEEAENGVQALECMSAFHPDLVLLDLIMPEMDGYETAQRIRANPEWSDTRIFAVTADVTKSAREKSRRSGVDEYLSKPVVVDLIFEKMGSHLNIEWIYEPAPTP